MHRQKTLMAGALISLLFLAACGSSGGLGDILGGGGGGSTSNTNEIRGTVDFVDANNRTITLTNVSGYTSMLSNSGGNTVRVYYDANTPVSYNNQSYRAEDLERGDEVAITVDQNSNNSLVARQIAVLRDVSTNSGSSYPSSGGTYQSTVRGTVRSVDTSRRTIQINRDGYSNSVVTVDFDPNTYVSFSGRQYTVADLEQGDEIEIRTRDLGSGRMLAQDISVLRSVSGTNNSGGGGGVYGGSPSGNYTTVRGTVRNVDTSRRTIELEQATWTNNFDRGAGSGNRNVIVQYGSNAGVEVNGQINDVSGLERGDIVDVYVQSTSGSQLYADRIILVRDVNTFR